MRRSKPNTPLKLNRIPDVQLPRYLESHRWRGAAEQVDANRWPRCPSRTSRTVRCRVVDIDRAGQTQCEVNAAITGTPSRSGEQFAEVDTQRKRKAEIQVQVEFMPRANGARSSKVEVENDVEGGFRRVVDDLRLHSRSNSERVLQQFLQLREARSERTVFRQRARSGATAASNSSKRSKPASVSN